MLADKDIQNLLSGLSETRQRNFLVFLRFVKIRQDLKSRETHSHFGRVPPKQPQAIPVNDFAYVGISENEVWYFLQLLRQIYKTVPPSPSKGILTVHLDLPTPQIESAPDGNKYATGLDGEAVSQIYKVLSKKLGGVDHVFQKENEQVITHVMPKVETKQRAWLIKKEGWGYLKFSTQGRNVRVGKLNTRKYRLLEVLLEARGAARAIDDVFENIQMPRDYFDNRLKDDYLARGRKRQVIEITMKELQKTKGLTGKVSLTYHHQGTTVALVLV